MPDVGMWIDVYDAAGVKVAGPIVNLTNVRVVERTSRIGELSFEVPGLDYIDAGMGYGLRYRLYSEQLGYLGQFYHRDERINPDNMTASVSAEDSTRLLADYSVGFGLRFAAGRRVGGTIAEIVSRFNTSAGVSWSVGFESGFITTDPIAVTFNGETYLEALDSIRAYMRGYWRRETDTRIIFGTYRNLGFAPTLYGTTTIYGQKRYRATPGVYSDNEIKARPMNVAVLSDKVGSGTTLITSLSVSGDGSNSINRIIPVGAGQGQTMLTLRRCTYSSPYAINTRLNPDGSTQYYLEDTASQALYGIHERMVPFSDIRPVTNSDADIQNAANWLYISAAAFLRKFAIPTVTYQCSVANLPSTAKVGTLVLLNYRGVVDVIRNGIMDGHRFITVSDVPVYIIEKTTDFGTTGVPQYSLVISSNGEGNVQEADLIAQIMKEIDRFNVHPTPNQTYYSLPSITSPVDKDRAVTLFYRIKNNVLYLNEISLRFRVTKLRTFAATALSGGGSVSGDGGGTQTGGSTGAVAPNSMGHSHTIMVLSGGIGASVGHSDNKFYASNGPGYVSTIATNEGDLRNHTHGFSITLSPHTHSTPDHVHGLTYGVFEDTTPPQDLSVWLNGAQLSNIRRDQPGDAIVGDTVDGEGSFTIDLLQDAVNQPNGIPQQNFAANYRIEFKCTAGQGQVFGFIDGRVTIQPIAV